MSKPQQDIHSELSVALQSADPRVLAALVTHLSGDCSLVGPEIEEDALRAIAVGVLAPFCTQQKHPAPPSDEVLQAAMDLCAGETVPPEYGPMMRDQAGLGPPLQAATRIEPPPGFRAVVIGAGLSGLCAAIAFDKAGVEFTILLKSSAKPTTPITKRSRPSWLAMCGRIRRWIAGTRTARAR